MHCQQLHGFSQKMFRCYAADISPALGVIFASNPSFIGSTNQRHTVPRFPRYRGLEKGEHRFAAAASVYSCPIVRKKNYLLYW